MTPNKIINTNDVCPRLFIESPPCVTIVFLIFDSNRLQRVLSYSDIVSSGPPDGRCLAAYELPIDGRDSRHPHQHVSPILWRLEFYVPPTLPTPIEAPRGTR